MLYKNIIKSIKQKDISKANYLLINYLKLNKEQLNNKKNISLIKILKFKISMKKDLPLQYIVGNVNFYGYIYKVNKNVLIPRFETEELVENTIKYINKLFKREVSIIDIGTGSGCIGITLKKELKEANVTLTDISTKALKTAKYNAKGEDIKLINTNMLDNINEKYDVIISNPPYISRDEEIMDIVKKYEPSEALYADNNGLYYYEEILKNCKKILNKDFLIAFEIGHNQKQKIYKIANKYLNSIVIDIKKDLQGRDRMMFIMNKK